MRLAISNSLQRLLKSTSLWKKHRIILREFKHFRKIAVLAIVFTLLSATFQGFGIGFILSFLQSLTDPNTDPAQTGIGWFDVWVLGVNSPNIERLYRISGLILLTTLLRLLFTYLGRYYSQISQFTLAYQLRLQLFEQLQALSLSYFTKNKPGNLVHSMTNETQEVTRAFDIISKLITLVSTFFVYLISMCLLSWQLTLISVMLLGLQLVGVSVLIRKVREASFKHSSVNRDFTSVSLEFLNGIRAVHAFAAQDFERKRHQNANLKLLQAATKARAAYALVDPLSEGISTAMFMGMLIFAVVVLIPNGQLQLASLLTFLFVLFRLVPIMRQINAARTQFGSFSGSLNQIKQILRSDNKPYFCNGKVRFSHLQRGIEFVGVDFGYQANELVLRDIWLTIPKGQTTAIVGASGAGKSTLVDLIPRFYDPTRGQILIDGVDLRKFEIGSLRRKMAIVSQETFIFNTSVRDNIAYALDAVDEESVWEAARLANALEFILELPQGFDTQLGERGIRLSGGQRQRIAIARALLRNPEILILDEATSALDSVSERLIQASLEKLSVGRTVVAIAHRLSTIMRADRVIVLEGGRIVEQGGYQELLSRQGKLWQYHKMQHGTAQPQPAQPN